MVLRKYTPGDLGEILDIFRNSVLACKGFYSEDRLAAWASAADNPEMWERTLGENYAIVAECGGRLAGFGDLKGADYFDRLYVRKEFQNTGLASAIAEAIESEASRRGAAAIKVHASSAARKFFERRGYELLEECEAVRMGLALTNFLMQKTLAK